MPRNPTLLKKITPAAQSGSEGSQSIAPTTTSDPRGSFTTADRKKSWSLRNRSSRSDNGPAPKSGPPLTTKRVGSPPVWESTTRIRRSPPSSRRVLLTPTSRGTPSREDSVKKSGEKCKDFKDLVQPSQECHE